MAGRQRLLWLLIGLACTACQSSIPQYFKPKEADPGVLEESTHQEGESASLTGSGVFQFQESNPPQDPEEEARLRNLTDESKKASVARKSGGSKTRGARSLQIQGRKAWTWTRPKSRIRYQATSFGSSKFGLLPTRFRFAGVSTIDDTEMRRLEKSLRPKSKVDLEDDPKTNKEPQKPKLLKPILLDTH